MYNLHKDLRFQLSPKLCGSFFNWIVDRDVKIGRWYVGRDADDGLLIPFSTMIVNVQKVIFHACERITVPSMIRSLSSFQGLREIDILSYRNVFDEDLWLKVFTRHPQLCRLFLSCVGKTFLSGFTSRMLTTLAEHNRALTSLSLSHCIELDDSSLALLAKCCSKLVHLNLSGCRLLTNNCLFAIGKHCIHLRVLRLSAARGTVTDFGMEYLLLHSRRLITLHIWDCSGITDRSIAALSPLRAQLTSLALCKCSAFYTVLAGATMRQFCNLNELHLPHCTGLSEQRLIDIIECSPHLGHIILTSVTTVTNDVVEAIARSCRKLWALNISGCRNVSSILPLSLCCEFCWLECKDCVAVSDEAVLLLADTAGFGFVLSVYAHGSGVTEATVRQLLDHPRLQLNMHASEI